MESPDCSDHEDSSAARTNGQSGRCTKGIWAKPILSYPHRNTSSLHNGGGLIQTMTATLASSAIAARPPEELVSFADRHIRNARANERLYLERRSETRQPLVLPVLVQPLDEDSTPVGEAFSAVTRDISPSGVGLIAAQPIRHKQLALQMHLAHEEVNVIAEVRWCKPMGPFEGIGCRFIRKLNDEPPPKRPPLHSSPRRDMEPRPSR